MDADNVADGTLFSDDHEEQKPLHRRSCYVFEHRRMLGAEHSHFMSRAFLSSARLHTCRRYARPYTSEAPAQLKHNLRPPQQSFPASYYRGGTSRGVLIQPQDLPLNRAQWPSIFRQIMGSPDPYGRQLDGMGAGISSLSKICLVERSMLLRSAGEKARPVIDYTFVGLGIETDEVDVAGNCGNMLSAIGPYAYNERLLDGQYYQAPEVARQVTVDIRNTNTGKLIRAQFDVYGGQAAVQGDESIDGVAGTGASIKLDFENPFGSKTGKVLPTGNIIDEVDGLEVSIVDGPNPAIYVRAEDLGVEGTVLPNDFAKLQKELDRLEYIRRKAAVQMGMADTEDTVTRTVPKIAIVSKSKNAHPTLSGQTVRREDVDVVVRFISDTQPHRAIPLTTALTTAVAAKIPGTIVEQALSGKPVSKGKLTIGHASGKIQVAAIMKPDSFEPKVASVFRTAKRIMDGVIYYTEDPATDGPELSSLPREYGTPEQLGLTFVKELREIQKRAQKA